MEEELRLRYLIYDYLITNKNVTYTELLEYLKEEKNFSNYSLVSQEKLLGYCLSLYLCFLKEQHIIRVDEPGTFTIINKETTKEVKWEILWLPLKYVMISK